MVQVMTRLLSTSGARAKRLAFDKRPYNILRNDYARSTATP